jgi:hypothetical protein
MNTKDAELKKLAEAASKDGGHTLTNWRDCDNWKANEEYAEAASPAAILELLAIKAELLEALRGLVEAEESIRATYTRAYGKTPEDEDHYGHEKWAEEFLQERADEARAAIAKATGNAT